MKFLLITISAVIILLFTWSGGINAQTEEDTSTSATDKPLLFVLDSCPYCNSLIDELVNSEIIETVELIEVSEDPNRSQFKEIIEECGVKEAVPTLYSDGRCYQGQFTARDQIFIANQLPLPDQVDNSAEETVTQLNSDSSENLGDPVNENLVDDSEDLTEDDQKEDSGSDDSLQKKIVQFNEGGTDVNFISVVAMLLAPITLLLIAYLIITKMKV